MSIYGSNGRIDTSETKKRLNAYRTLVREIENQSERLERFETRLYTVGSPDMSPMPKAATPSNTLLIDMIVKRDEIAAKLKRMEEARDAEAAAIAAAADKLSDPDERAIIVNRYIDGVNWPDVINLLFGGRTDYLERMATYERRVYREHGEALIHMTLIFETGTEALPDNTDNTRFEPWRPGNPQ